MTADILITGSILFMLALCALATAVLVAIF
jgi:hypothetical protein